MSAFKDSLGREWLLKINFGVASAMKERAGVNLNAILKDATVLDEIVGDPFKFFTVLSVLVEKQLRERKLTLEEFGESLDDEEIVTSAMKAFVEAVIDFFPADRRRALRKAFETLWSATERKANAKVKAAIEELESLDMEALADELIETSISSSSVPNSGAASD